MIQNYFVLLISLLSQQIIAETIINVPIGHIQTISQSFSQQIFQLQITDWTQYQLFEIKISSSSNNNYTLLPYLGLNYNSIPFDAQLASQIDQNNHFQNKNYHYILIPPNSNTKNQNAQGQTIVYCMFQVVGTSVYQFSLSQYKTKPCPNNCNSNQQQGVCQSGQCQCNSNRIDEDCSSVGQPLQKDVQESITLMLGQTQYCQFMPSKDQTRNLQIQINKGDGLLLQFYINIQGRQLSIVPTQFNYFNQSVMVPYQNNYTILREDFFDAGGNPLKIIIGLMQGQQKSADLDLQIKDFIEPPLPSGSNAIMIIVYCVIGLVALLLIAVIFLKVKRYLNPEDQDLNSQANEVVNNNINNNNDQQQIQQQQKKKSERTLSIDKINHYMPFYYFEDILKEGQIKKEDLTNECSVCLEKYEKKTLVRITICGHLFHKNCLEKWLKKQESCPNCRHGLTEMHLKLWKKDIVYQMKKLQEVEQNLYFEATKEATKEILKMERNKNLKRNQKNAGQNKNTIQNASNIQYTDMHNTSERPLVSQSYVQNQTSNQNESEFLNQQYPPQELQEQYLQQIKLSHSRKENSNFQNINNNNNNFDQISIQYKRGSNQQLINSANHSFVRDQVDSSQLNQQQKFDIEFADGSNINQQPFGNNLNVPRADTNVDYMKQSFGVSQNISMFQEEKKESEEDVYDENQQIQELKEVEFDNGYQNISNKKINLRKERLKKLQIDKKMQNSNSNNNTPEQSQPNIFLESIQNTTSQTNNNTVINNNQTKQTNALHINSDPILEQNNNNDDENLDFLRKQVNMNESIEIQQLH